MAHQTSRPSRQLPAELRATKGALDQRWIELSRLIAMALEPTPDRDALRVEAEYQSNQVWAGLQGSVCERVTRNRGGASIVAPLCPISGGLTAWLSWQEVWDIAPGKRPFRFRNAGLTVYLGKSFEAVKPQAFRLEWPGISNWSGGEVSFQSPGAGHPHWQLDLMQSLAEATPAPEFEPESEEIVEDFEAAVVEPTTIELLTKFSIERMHLASAAPWWLPASSGDVGHHMNAPADLSELSRWLSQSLLYLKQELKRCVIKP